MKKIIFYSDAGFPFSVLAAAIRTGSLPGHRRPRTSELSEVLGICGVGRGDASVYRLENDGSERCLALWTAGQGDMVGRIVTSFLALYGIQDYQLVRLEHRKTAWIAAGAWLARLPPLRGTAMALICRGLTGIYGELVHAARRA